MTKKDGANAPKYKFLREDPGNCRVYYKDHDRLFCLQRDSPKNVTFYRCSEDGEPEYECLMPNLAEFSGLKVP